MILEQKRQKRTSFALNFCGTYTASLLPCFSSSELKSDFRLQLRFLEYLPPWKSASSLIKCGIPVEYEGNFESSAAHKKISKLLELLL